jgi:type II secretory pathway pseudopilin PulG
VRYVAIAILSITATLAIVSIGIAQNGQNQAPSGAKKPAARVSQSHQDLAKGAGAKTPATARNAGTNDNQPRDPDHIMTFEEHKAIPYRACINARGWKNGGLVCADDGDKVQFQNGREVEGPLSPQ